MHTMWNVPVRNIPQLKVLMYRQQMSITHSAAGGDKPTINKENEMRKQNMRKQMTGGGVSIPSSPNLCFYSEETHLMSPKSFLFPAMATTMSSGPCSFSSFTHFFSVWKESWATRNTTQLRERIHV